MAEVEIPSTKDLLLLIAGFYVPKVPPVNANSGQAYWLTEAANGTRSLREAKENSNWTKSPRAAWDGVRFRDWLLAALFGTIASHKNEFVAISEPMLASIDVLGKEFTNDMKGVSDTIQAALKSKDGRPRSLFNTLSIGISRHQLKDKTEVFMLGAGIRRRARFWKTESLAIQADVEFYVPFFEIPNSEPAVEAHHTNSINAGIALSYSDGSPLGKDGDKELIALRMNLRTPFGSRWKTDFDLETIFDRPIINVQKRTRDNAESAVSDWQKFDGWKKFVEDFCESLDGKELLNVPIGPLLLEKLSGPAGLEDLFIWQSLKEVKDDLKRDLKELKDTIELLDSVHKIKVPEKDGVGPNAGQRKLGHMLESLGFMNAKGRPESEYKFKITEGLTVWDVVNRLFAELDGYPIYVKGTKPKQEKEPRIAVSFASQTSETNPAQSNFGLAGIVYNIPLKTAPPGTPPPKEDKEDKDKPKSYDEIVQIIVDQNNFARDRRIFWDDEEEEEFNAAHKPPKPDKEPELKSMVEVFLHLGKWFSDETLDDNWYRRLLPLPDPKLKPRVPIPGIRVLPIKRVATALQTGAQQADFSWTFRADLLSLGIDIKGSTKAGLTFLKGVAGHFGLGAIEIRFCLGMSSEGMRTQKDWFEEISIGVGVKLKDLRLSLTGKDEEPKEDEKDDVRKGLQNIFSDKPKTRLSGKKKDKFSISVGYLTPLTKGSKGTLDIQLYDEKGVRGKLAVITIDRSVGPFYLKQIGIGLQGTENIDLSNFPNEARLTVSITGGLRFSAVELALIGGRLSFQLNDPSNWVLGFDGFDISVKVGGVIASGSFFLSGPEYAGMLTIDHPKASFSAMGFYGSMTVFKIGRKKEMLDELDAGKIPKTLGEKLVAEKITPAQSTPVTKNRAINEWELTAADSTAYTVRIIENDLYLLRPEKTFFIYAMLSAANGCGPTIGPIQFTGIALGYGYNRSLIVPRIEEVAKFPLVQMALGESKAQNFDISKQLGKPLEDPVSVLADMKDYVVQQQGQQFACLGVRFTVSGIITCFALVVVQWTYSEIELSMIGLARFQHPRDPKATPICYVELQLLMTLKPKDGTFQLQALLTNNSWIVNKDCKLTGGFALFVWFDGEHKGDWVITFGGYHPRFVRPAHYPIVPRIGVNWRISNNLTMKGSMYLAITPSCGMLGLRSEMVFRAGRVSAWFTAFLDVIVNWQPLYFEADIGISLRVEVSLWITSLKVTIGASIRMWGPPVGGIAHIDLAVISFDIDFGEKPKKPELVSSWQVFCYNFLNLSGSDTATDAFPVVQPTLASGRNNVSNIPNSRREQPSDKRDDDVWIVRGDELELAAASVVPVSKLNVGTVMTNSPPAGVQPTTLSGKSMMVTEPLVLENKGRLKGVLRSNKPQSFSVHPMGKTLGSVLNVTIVQDEAGKTRPTNLAGWTMEEEISALPAALWDPAKPNLTPSEPSAKLLEGCITGLKKLRPPRGTLGNKFAPKRLDWHALAVREVSRPLASQETPSATTSRDIRSSMAAKQDEQKKVAAALTTAGFTLAWTAPATEVRFRELQADPLAGVVAA